MKWKNIKNHLKVALALIKEVGVVKYVKTISAYKLLALAAIIAILLLTAIFLMRTPAGPLIVAVGIYVTTSLRQKNRDAKAAEEVKHEQRLIDKKNLFVDFVYSFLEDTKMERMHFIGIDFRRNIVQVTLAADTTIITVNGVDCVRVIVPLTMAFNGDKITLDCFNATMKNYAKNYCKENGMNCCAFDPEQSYIQIVAIAPKGYELQITFFALDCNEAVQYMQQLAPEKRKRIYLPSLDEMLEDDLHEQDYLDELERMRLDDIDFDIDINPNETEDAYL